MKNYRLVFSAVPYLLFFTQHAQATGTVFCERADSYTLSGEIDDYGHAALTFRTPYNDLNFSGNLVKIHDPGFLKFVVNGYVHSGVWLTFTFRGKLAEEDTYSGEGIVQGLNRDGVFANGHCNISGPIPFKPSPQ